MRPLAGTHDVREVELGGQAGGLADAEGPPARSSLEEAGVEAVLAGEVQS
ncbi:hypothetical protein [Streptomyces sp. NPDC058964]